MSDKINQTKHKNVDVFEVDSKGFELTDEGYLIIDSYATRTGVFKYQLSDGTTLRQYRPSEEVFNPDSYSTLANKPVTNNHPPEFVDATNAKKYKVGHVRDGVQVVNNKYLKASLVINDADTIAEIKERNKVQVSCGYTCVHDETDGVDGNERYDVIQRNIRYNHISLVDKGRAGESVRLLTDSKDDVYYMVDSESEDKQEQPLEDKDNCIKKRSKMETITIDGVSQEVSKEFKDAYEKLRDSKKVADAVAEAEELKKGFDSKVAECDSLSEKVEKLEGEVKKYDALISDRNKADLVFEAVSKGLVEKDFIVIDGLSEVEIKKAILEKNEVRMSLDSEEYITGRYADFLVDSEQSKKEKVKFDSESIVKKEDSVASPKVNEDSFAYQSRRKERMSKKGVN